MHHRMPLSKTRWASLNMVIFPPVMRLVLCNQKQWPPWRLLIKFTSLSCKTTGFRLNQYLSNWASYMSRLGPSFMKIWTCKSSPQSGSRNAWTSIKTANGASRLSNFWNFFGAIQIISCRIAIGDHGQNVVIPLWPGDKAPINGVAAQRLNPPQKISSAKIRWKSSHPDFLWLRQHSPHWLFSKGPNCQRGVSLNSAGAIEGHSEGKTLLEGHQGGLVLAQQRPGSQGTCNPEETGLPGLPMSITHPIPWIWPCQTTTCSLDWKKKQLKCRHFSSDAEVIAAAETLLDRHHSEFFWVACKSYSNGLRSVLRFVGSMLNKSEFGRCSLFPSWSG